MTTDPRAALDRLIAALEAHLHAASRRTGEADPAVVAAYQTLADAFESYDDALYTAYDEVTPFVLYDDSEDDEDEGDEGDEEEDDDDVLDSLDEDDDEDDDEEEDDLDDDELLEVEAAANSERGNTPTRH
jgi:hypothetical protein